MNKAEIVQMALELGLLETQGATPEMTMAAQIAVDIKTKGKGSDFIRTTAGYFALNKNKQKIKESDKVVAKEKAEEEKVKIESTFTGKAGEHAVCSQLLFRGYNASIMSVDLGLDIVTTKKDKVFGIQVKTSNLNKFNTYVFDIRKVSFERHSSSNIYYIFVLHGKDKTNYLILPYVEMERKIYEKAILSIDQYKKYRVNIKIRNNKITLGTKEHDVSYFLDRWDIIK